MIKKLFFLLFSTLLLLSPLTQANALDNKFDFLGDEQALMPVEQAFAFDFEQKDNIVYVDWVIADDYYMYRDKLKFSIDNGELGDINLPIGKIHNDDYFGEQNVYYINAQFPIAIKQADQDAVLTITFMGCAEGKLCYPPTKQIIKLNQVAANDGVLPESDSPAPAITEAAPATEQNLLSDKLLSGDNKILNWLSFFILGIGLALTPCVFPMYPILSGIIVGQKGKTSTKKAFSLSMTYVQGMAITYSILGLVVASAGLKYQAALQSAPVLIGISILFVLLSLSMFGLYEIQLPASWQNKMNNMSNKQQGGTYLSVFTMGVLSGLVASPCTTAPLSAVLIYVAQTGNMVEGFFTLYILSMGMGVPLLLMGTSGGKLLPKAGAWMDIIKHIFGFLLIVVAIIMLGRIWPGTVSDLLWSAWGICFVGYLIHQNKLTQFNWKQTAREIFLLLMLFVSFGYGIQSIMPSSSVTQTDSHDKFTQIKSVDDLTKQINIAKSAGIPVMLDFYADWCVSCKEFSHITFVDPEVAQRMDSMMLLQADVTAMDEIDTKLLEAYGVSGLPTILFFDKNGKHQDNLRVTGFMGPDKFAPHLDHIVAN